jgi:hypothetical protein
MCEGIKKWLHVCCIGKYSKKNYENIEIGREEKGRKQSTRLERMIAAHMEEFKKGIILVVDLS